MAVYVVYGFSFGEIFCDGLFQNYENALQYIANDFTNFICEQVELGEITERDGTVWITRMSLWAMGHCINGYSKNLYFHYKENEESNDDNEIVYRISKQEIK